MRHKVIAVVSTAVLLLSLSGCTKKKEDANTNQPPSNPTNVTPTESTSVTETVKAKSLEVPASFQKTFVGTLNGKIAIQMELHRQGDDLYGSYFYENIREPLDLAGKIDKNGSCKLTESANDQDTGIFKGKLTGVDTGADVALKFEGTWSKPNGEKPMPFSLQEQQFTFSGGLRLVAKERKEENKKQHYEMELSYPLIEGATDARAGGFNKAVLKIIEDNVKALKKDAPEAYDKNNPDAPPSGLHVSYDVTLATDDLISVIFTVSDYSSGAAHPNSSSVTLNYDLRNGREIKLADLFNPGASFIPVLSSNCIKILTPRLKKLEALDQETLKGGAGPDAQNFQNWNVMRKGLLFTFDPYQVAAYAFGPQETLVPYSTLKDILKPDSPISAIINSQETVK